MAKEKANIVAVRNGVPVGYVESVSYAKRTYKLTKNRMDAKGYTKQDKIQYDIDFLTSIAYTDGYIFIYN